ncbi:TonB-dependent receptor [Ochrovirga pacifica]|uniref:TonB-dependent receptor n=1 Tax=Ochrovirga pacifica TaxID=1042376 RepID=UPI000255984A|nr:TonB-dependent receptor [Ochrovirga pacifica]
MKSLLLLLGFLSVAAMAQRNHHRQHGGKHAVLMGKVVDTHGQPLMGATILVDDNKYAAVSNDKGMYFIHNLVLGKHQVKASYMGYVVQQKPITIRQRKTLCDFELKEDSQSLQEVKLSAKSHKTEIETKGFAVSVVETKEASFRNIQTNELLNSTVGVKIRQNGGLGSNVEYSLNGLSGSSVRIFIDGIPMSMYGSSFSLNSIPPAMIENIEVYKGVVPGHLADDALGGAINIVMKKGTDRNYVNASASYGSFNTFQANASGFYRFNKGFTVKFSSFYNYSDNDYEVWGPGVVDVLPNSKTIEIKAKRFNDAYESKGVVFQTGFTNVSWADQFYIGFTGSDDYKEIQHGAFMSTYPYKDRFMESDAQLATLLYQKKDLFIDGLDINLNGLYGTRNRMVSDTNPFIYTWRGELWQDGQNNNQPREYNYGSQQEKDTYGPVLNFIERHVSSMRSGLSYEITPQHKILLNHVYSGIERDDYDEYATDLSNAFTETKDLYKQIYSLSYELNLFKERLKLNLFGKHYRQKVLNNKPSFNENRTEVINDVYKSDKDYNGYGFATSFEVLPVITLMASAEKAVRLPSENEVFGNAGDNISGNRSIKPEISNNINLGIRLGKFSYKNHGLVATTNFFTRNIQDLIGLPINANQLEQDDEVITYGNLENTTKSKGVEFQLNYNFKNNLTAHFNYSRLSLTTTRNGLEIDVANTPLFTMNGGLRYTFQNVFQPQGRLNLFYNFYFTDSFSYKYADGTHTADNGSHIVPTQWVQDLGLNYAFPKNQWVVSFDVKNIFDKAAYDNLSVQKPGRAYYLKLNYTINKL